jgi:hypothetical protein
VRLTREAEIRAGSVGELVGSEFYYVGRRNLFFVLAVVGAAAIVALAWNWFLLAAPLYCLFDALCAQAVVSSIRAELSRRRSAGASPAPSRR